MANVYYGNNGVIDLMPATLDRHRDVRSVDRATAQELNAIVVTERAVHVFDFKWSEALVKIATDGKW